GEVESRLWSHPGVRDVATLVYDGRTGRELVAFLVASGSPVPSGELRDYLGRWLPAAMIPSRFEWCDAIPTTASGKADGKRLTARLADGAGRGAIGDAPRTGTERRLAALWCEILGVHAVGLRDRFLDLGGHSLAAARLANRALSDQAIAVAVKDLLANASLAELAAAADAGAPPAAARIPLAPAAPRHRLSHAQRRLWLLDQIGDQRGNPAYQLSAQFEVTGPLDVDRLGVAFRAVFRRHEILRTRIVEVDGEPWQEIVEDPPFAVAVHDYSRERDPRACVAALVREDLGRPFDLSHAPLVRCAVATLGPGRFALLLQLHHIVIDGWSAGILVNELAGWYNAGGTPEGAPLDPLPIQYKDYAAWQAGLLESGALDPSRQYWRQVFADAVTPLDLPRDRPRPSLQTFDGDDVPIELDEELTGGLYGLAHRSGASLFTVLAAAVKALLHRCTGQEDIVIGTPVAVRNHPDLEHQIGFYTNTLALRDRVTGGQRFLDLVAAVRRTVAEGLEHQSYPFDLVVEDVAPVRDPSRSPLFDVMLNLLGRDEKTIALDGLRVAPLNVAPATSQFDVSVEFREGGRCLGGLLRFNDRLYDRARMERLAGHLVQLLRSVAADPGARLSDLALMTGAERHRLLVEWNDTEAPYSSGRCLHELIGAQAARSPAAPALLCEGGELSHAGLDVRSNRLARHLVRLGVGPDVRVGVCLERSLDLPVALLAILKAGGAYVPLDPDYPQARLAFMVKDAACAVLITRSDLRQRLAGGSGGEPGTPVPVVCLDTDDADVQAMDGGPLADADRIAPVTSDNLAYVIYTSGSTGVPKGAMNTHRAVVNRLEWMQAACRIDGTDCVLQKTPYSFDVSVWELFWPLMTGARLCLARPGGHKDADYLIDLINEQGVTVLHFVPSMLQAFLQAPRAGTCANVRRVICSGEALPPETAGLFFARLPAELHNLYGPTEAAIDVTHWTCRAGPVPASIPIGRPIANTSLYIVDEALNPVPIGVAGELLIGGVPVARGYLDRPDLTAEKFIPNPFGAGRLYRTGDLSRYRSDGAIEFLGRLDGQVKLRGFRVELGEIESALVGCRTIAEAAVSLDADEDGGRLTAYVVPAAGGDMPAVAALQRDLSERLPDHMIPSRYVRVESLPRTSSGKLDRRALSSTPGLEVAAGTPYRAPRTALEATLARLWSAVLGVERVGLDDNFFHLGGSSLKAARLVSAAAREHQMTLRVRDLLLAPTLAALAARVAGSPASLAAPIPACPPSRFYPLSHGQQRLWLLEHFHEGREGSTYVVPAAFDVEGALDAERLEEAFAHLVRRHEILRTRFVEVGGEPQQEVLEEPPFAMQTVDLRGRADADAAAASWAAAYVAEPFDLARGPLFRVALLTLGDERHVLLVSQHHIIGDAWSDGVLMREVAASYAALRRGRPIALPPLRLQYRDYAVWQRRLLSSPEMAAHRDYWQGVFNEPVTPLRLPIDFPRPAVQRVDGARVGIALDPPLAREVEQFARTQQTTLFAVLLAALSVLLHRYTQAEDIVVGTPVAGRLNPELDSQIGFYVNTLALRLPLRPDRSGAAIVRLAADRLAEALEHQAYPFDRLVEELQIRRDLGRSPLFDVMVVHGERQEPFELEGVRLTPRALESRTSHFDLTFLFGEGSDTLEIAVEYSTALFQRGTIERMAAHYRALLLALVRRPEGAVGGLPMLLDPERQALVETWGRSPEPLAPGVTVLDLFRARVAARPSAVAVESEEGRLSYADLDGRSDRVAALLRDRHRIGPEEIVALRMPRSRAFVVWVLGILKAGGAFLPIDTSYPMARDLHILRDSGARFLATDDVEAVRELEFGGTVLPADAIAEPPAPGGGTPGPDGSRLAYVIYTSGSTGLPKGVALHHEGLANLAAAQLRAFEVREDSRVAQFASLGFDASVSEIFMALVAGAALVIVPEAVKQNPSVFPRWIEESAIGVVTLPPAYLRALDGSRLPGLKTLVTAGEEADREEALARARHLRYINAYGPTENTVCASWHQVPAGGLHAGAVPIGRPLANVQLYVVDARMEIVPVGIPGEICIGGVGVARGYLGRPAETAARFVPDPFGGQAGGRLYRTGDLGRWTPEGLLEFLGRQDRQVQVRGARVEPGEVEAVLETHPHVRRAVVFATGSAESRQLVAVAWISAPTPDEELKAHLRRALPSYMLPARVIPVSRLPLTPHGKVDLEALARQVAAEPVRGQAVGPLDSLEAGLVEEWERALGTGPIGVRDDFFELGGHSLLALQLAGRLQERFGVDLSLPTLFRFPTIERLAAHLRESAPVRRRWTGVVPIRQAGDRPPLLCLPPLTGSAVPFFTLAKHLGEDRPVYGLQAPGLDGEEPACETVEAIADRLEREIVREFPARDVTLLGYSFGGYVAYELAHRLAARGTGVRGCLLIDTLAAAAAPQAPAPGTGPLLEAINARVRELGGASIAFGEAVDALSEGEQLEMVTAALERQGLLSGFGGRRQLSGFFRVGAASLRAAARYRPGRSTMPLVVLPSLGSIAPAGSAGDLGWRAATGADVTVLAAVDAPHEALLQEPYAAEAGRLIRAYLDTGRR
ncbi:MAG TPA: amino acid adenylation domain-containing protein, partial [Vicinamibacterales bacterium]|nr:amino acid adenylation domain-containing protein [Vicinamibacterales bacterium]